MKKIIMSLSILSVLILFTGCATVISGTSQTITFDSSPSGAAIFLDGNRIGVTPFTTSLKKNKYSSFRIELEGYHTISRQLDKEFDIVTLLSIFWDLGTTDFISGAVYKYGQNSYFVELQKK
jgi:uncharacterized protein YceK|tara:strand:+ start:213 stop:578 length:366 start_codon:yes stop_codon:yes gene_type:complete